MLLHACLLLFITTTDKTLAQSPQRRGGDVSLDQGPVCRLSLTVPGLISVTHGLNSMNQLSLCTWTIHIPPGRTLLLKLAGLEGDSSVSVRCVRNQNTQDQVLESTGTVLLSGCDGNQAALTWTGAGTSSDVIQRSYYVQEDERNSSEDHTSPLPDGDLLHWSPTGTSSSSRVSEKAVRGTDGVRGHNALEWSPGPRPVSGPSSRDEGRLHPTSPRQGLSGVAGTGTLPLPEERPNNGADTSGVAHHSNEPISATHPYFPHTDSSNTETNSSNEPVKTPTDATTRRSSTSPGTDTHKYTTSLAPKHAGQHKTTQAHTSRSSFNHFPSLTSSSFPELRSLATWESATVPVPRGAAASGTAGEVQPHSWRSQRSTDGLDSDRTSAITSDPLESPTEPPQDDASSAHTYIEPTGSSTSLQTTAETHQSSSTHITESDAGFGSGAPGSFQPNTSWSSSESATSDVSSGAASFEPSDKLDNVVKLHVSETNSPQSTEGLTRSPHTPATFTQTHTGTESTQTNVTDANTVPSSPEVEGETASGNSAATETTTETFTLSPTDTLPRGHSPTESPVPPLQTNTFPHQPAPSYTHTTISGSSPANRTPTSLTSDPTPTVHADDETEPPSSQASTITFTPSHTPLLSSTHNPATHTQPHGSITTAPSTLSSPTTAHSEYREVEVQAEDESTQPFPSSTTTHTPTAGTPGGPPPRSTPSPSQETTTTTSALTSAPTWSSSSSPTPRFYIVPDRPASVKGESIELLLQMIVEESRSAAPAGLEEDTTAWMEPYLQKAPGFSRLLGVWSSGHAVQSLVEFETSGALQWLGETGPTSLLERTGLAQAAREGRRFRASRITNVTLGGLQGDVCDWLLQCPSGYRCVYRPGIANYNCSSVCRFDHCHNHGICTHHPGQLPVCRCLVGEDFWFMGQRCDVRMTQGRLVGACLAVLLIMVTAISILAFLAVRRYRAILIQAKVDQTRSSYRRFNHFDELSGRFWLRSWAGSADSMDNPAFTRSDELLHLRALDRPCCYHDDTLSLASTCPSHGTHINTIYPHSSQYAWRGSEMSMGEGVLDSGKASDLSVCSWPVEPIHWTPFPLLQQLASHRTPTVRISRPRSYCEGMELVDLGKSWTA